MEENCLGNDREEEAWTIFTGEATNHTPLWSGLQLAPWTCLQTTHSI